MSINGNKMVYNVSNLQKEEKPKKSIRKNEILRKSAEKKTEYSFVKYWKLGTK